VFKGFNPKGSGYGSQGGAREFYDCPSDICGRGVWGLSRGGFRVLYDQRNKDLHFSARKLGGKELSTFSLCVSM